jgi:signal transduction histidine kinase
MKLQIPFLRPFAAWVTDLIDSYRFNLNVRATLQIIVLQAGLTLLSVLVFGWAIQYAQNDTIAYISQHIRDLMSGTTPDPDTTLLENVAQVRTRTYTIVFTGLVALNVLFGYFIARFALRPGRQSIDFQKRFIGNVAHEIRTPLSIIKTSTEVALFDPELASDIRSTMEGTVSELDRISETINNLLSFDSLMQPKAMRFEPVDLGALASVVVARHQELAHSRNITLSCACSEGAIVLGNATALDQLITNLLKNALHYTPANAGGRVTVEVAAAQDGRVALSVIDTGIGIAQKDLYHIFEPFYRADTSRARGIGTGSSGLGLAIVHEIIRHHHGIIALRSAPGHGTTIKVTFPHAKNTSATLPLLAPSGSPHEATLDFS